MFACGESFARARIRIARAYVLYIAHYYVYTRRNVKHLFVLSAEKRRIAQ